MYHRFPPVSHFKEQCIHLKQFYRPASLNEIGLWLHQGKKIDPNTIVVTVDDGYRDFFLNAFPVLSELSIPAIVYLATDMLDQGSCLWVDWVGVLFQASRLSKAALAVPGSKGLDADLTTPENRRHAAFQTKEALKRAPNQARLAFLERLPKLLGIDQPPARPVEYEPLTWDEVRQMCAAGIEFGAHTQSHPILANLENRDLIWTELDGSKARIEQETGRPVHHFCYPNGRLCDFNPETIQVVRDCGFVTAVTGEKGINFVGADPFQLRRIHQEPLIPLVQFAHQVAGLGR